jgi:multidrug resistance efflux pump
MKLTVRRSLAIALTLFVFLLLASLGLILLPVDRRVTIPGVFAYREVHPVVCETPGFVAEIFVETDSSLEGGTPILRLSNSELESELRRTTVSVDMIDLELREILRAGGYDATVGELDVSRMREDLSFRRDRLAYLEEAMQSARDLAGRNLASRRSYEEAELDYKEELARVSELEIDLAKAQRNLQELDTATRLQYEVKTKQHEIELERLALLQSQQEKLIVRAPATGRLVAPDIHKLRNTRLTAGTQIGEVVSDDLLFKAVAGGVDVVRIREGQNVYFNVELFRRKQIVQGRVARVGAQPSSGSVTGFPVEIEVPDRRFFDRGRELFLQAGVTGEAVVVTEEGLPLARVLWERVIDAVDPY